MLGLLIELQLDHGNSARVAQALTHHYLFLSQDTQREETKPAFCYEQFTGD